MKFLRQDGWFQPVAGADIVTSTATTTGFLTYLTKATTADVLLNNTANYFDGPVVSQGTTGTWFATGTVTVTDSVANPIFAKLWDGTTVIASARTLAGPNSATMSLSGIIANPAGNLRISCNDPNTTNGAIRFNQTSLGTDSTIVVIRIG